MVLDYTCINLISSIICRVADCIPKCFHGKYRSLQVAPEILDRPLIMRLRKIHQCISGLGCIGHPINGNLILESHLRWINKSLIRREITLRDTVVRRSKVDNIPHGCSGGVLPQSPPCLLHGLCVDNKIEFRIRTPGPQVVKIRKSPLISVLIV